MSEFSERGLFAPPPRRLYSIDPTDNFLHQLALGAIASVDTTDPFALADMTIFLPTRRAVRGLIDAFADVTGVPEQSGFPNDPKTGKSHSRALLLPQIVSIGDIDDTETLEIDTINGGIESAAIAPPISTTERLIVLARLVAAKEKAFSGNDSWPAALAAARELSALLDSFYTEEIPLSNLATAVPPEHAAHWQQSLSFLEIVAEAWPAYLCERGLSDPSEYRAAVIAQRAQALRDHPPTSPVLIAGTTASAPSVARLVDAVSLAPKGAAVLPGLDRHLNKKAWASVDDGHPQAGLKALLQKLDCEPESVLRWPTQDNVRPRSSEGMARQKVFSISLRPAEATDDWFDLSKSVGADVGAAIQNLEIVEAANEDAEAAAIAICLRQAIEQPASTAMLVTPDRSLARRVSAKMTRWGVSVDDSAGAELPSTPLGTFLLLLAKFLSTPDDAVAFLSLIDHPLTDKRDLSEDTISGIDLALRGPLPSSKTPGSFTTVRKRIEQSLYEQSGEGTDTDKSIDAWLDRFDNSTRQWPRTAEFSTYLEVHSQIVERLAVSGEDPSAVWSGDSGISAASLMSDVMGSMANAGSPTVSRSEYPAAFHAMAAGVTIRSRRLTHPRIQILGPLEARLQHADLTILGGLNEGVWPSDAAVGAFLSRGMRESLGLQSPERKIGLAAHDFSQLAAKPTVILTRATKAADGPTKPSRWLLRLQNLLAGLDSLSVDNAGPALSKTIETGAKYAEWSRQLLSNGMGADQGTPLSSPSPTPPVSARPRKMSVTKIEKWLRDPYSVYAQDILRLRKLDEPNERFARRHLGSVMHGLFEKITKEQSSRDPDDLLTVLAPIAENAGASADDLIYWRPTLRRAIVGFLEYDDDRCKEAETVLAERIGSAVLDAAAGPFELVGRADRIEILKNGRAFIADYKSSRQSEKEAKAFNPQLELLGFILNEGGFAPPLDALKTEGFEFFAFLASQAGHHCSVTGEEAIERIDLASSRLLKLINTFDDPLTPYLSQPRPKFRNEYGDYDVLARRREWADAGGDDFGQTGDGP